MNKQIWPIPAVGALIFNKQNEIFLMRSSKWKNKYVVPGGKIELGETVKEAVSREVKEETGLRVKNIEFFQLQELIYDKAYRKKKHFVLLDFTCKTNYKKVRLNSESQSYLWLPLEKALKISLGPYTKNLINEYIRRQSKLTNV